MIGSPLTEGAFSAEMPNCTPRQGPAVEVTDLIWYLAFNMIKEPQEALAHEPSSAGHFQPHHMLDRPPHSSLLMCAGLAPDMEGKPFHLDSAAVE